MTRVVVSLSAETARPLFNVMVALSPMEASTLLNVNTNANEPASVSLLSDPY